MLMVEHPALLILVDINDTCRIILKTFLWKFSCWSGKSAVAAKTAHIAETAFNNGVQITW